jgi:hypothetical protein
MQLAQDDGAADQDVRDPDGWHELEVANPSFLVEKLGAECTDLQGLRELTVNALEAIAALGSGVEGRVVWDLDWRRFEASGGRERKLSIIDTGVGMTAEQMRYYINHLAASSHQQGRTKNFGVGAKIAAGSRNPHGLEYRSWHQGDGALIRFKRDPNGRWGLEPQDWRDGRREFWRPLGESEKPWVLRGRAHGTQVVLLGQHERDDTTRAPTSVSEARQRWVTRYLNTHFLRLPERVELLVRDTPHRNVWRDASELERILGQLHHLERRAIAAGVVELSDARAHWWVLAEDHRARRRHPATWTSTGHVAALRENELYDTLPQTRGGYQRLHEFGIRFGYERVVLYLEPEASDRLETNTARTLLLLDHEPLPWPRWEEEFRAAMPAELRRLQERLADSDDGSRRDAIRERLAAHLPLYRISRYRAPRLPGSPVTDPGDSPRPDVDEPHAHAPEPHTAQRWPAEREAEPCPAPEEGEDRGNVEAAVVELPEVMWVSVRDRTRAPGDLEDQAARYHVERHELTINADFRVFADMMSRWERRYQGVPGAHGTIAALVREWFEQALVEVVLSARSFGRSPHWDSNDLAALLSPAALTAAVLPRQLVDAQIKKRLAQKLGR